MRGIGISGTKENGKLALAIAYAGQSDCELLPFESDAVFMGVRAKLTTRGIIREYGNLLAYLESSYMKRTSRFVTNVTPLDVMADLYSTFSWFNEPSNVANKKVDKLWEDACRVCDRYFFIILHMQPFEANARAEHVNAVGAGLIHTRLVNTIDTKMFTIRRSMVELDSRLAALKNFVFSQYVDETPCESTSSLHH